MAFDVFGVDIDEAKMRELGQDKTKLPVKVDVFAGLYALR